MKRSTSTNLRPFTTERLRRIEEEVVKDSRVCVEYELYGEDAGLYCELRNGCENEGVSTETMLRQIYQAGVIAYREGIERRREIAKFLSKESKQFLANKSNEEGQLVSFMLYADKAHGYQRLSAACKEQGIDMRFLLMKIHQLGLHFYTKKAGKIKRRAFEIEEERRDSKIVRELIQDYIPLKGGTFFKIKN